MDLLKRQEEVDNLVRDAFCEVLDSTATEKAKVVLDDLEFDCDVLDMNYLDFSNLIHSKFLLNETELPIPKVKELKSELRNVDEGLFKFYKDIALLNCMLSIDFTKDGETTPLLFTNQSFTYNRLYDCIKNYNDNYGNADKVVVRLPYDNVVDITGVYHNM